MSFRTERPGGPSGSRSRSCSRSRTRSRWPVTTPRPRPRSPSFPPAKSRPRGGAWSSDPAWKGERNPVALQGSLDDFSLPEILQLIAVQQKSGVLRLTSKDDVAVIFFEGGRVVSTRDRSRNAKDPLKPFLLQTGGLSAAQLRQIETIEAESRRDLIDILLNGNYMTGEELSRALEHQVQDTLHQLLTWK